ncbi:MAG: hypothetical protein Q9220_006103 [cf. Caloplaca sp. 1 TL-2023]
MPGAASGISANGQQDGIQSPQHHDGDTDISTYRPLSRSPHPYVRRPREILVTTAGINDSCDLPPPHTNRDAENLRPPGDPLSSGFLDVDNRKRRKAPSTPSNSGSEADDESGPFLKGLPAPPFRLRKGLKNEATSGISSPLLTPSYLDDAKRKEVSEFDFHRQGNAQHQVPTDEASQKIQDKFNKRRRAELIRRTTETILLFGIGCISCRSSLWLPDEKDLIFALLTICTTYMLYPLRLFIHHYRPRRNIKPSIQFIQVPAAFDPATLLYPVLIPIFVAASLKPYDSLYLSINTVLGIASMPRAIVPSQDSLSGHTSVLWLLSVLPLVLSGKNDIRSQETCAPSIADPEILVLLYPLHQALLPTFGYLTTTSLLPAELQLLSVSMINILLLSTSPQAQAFQVTMWVGGLFLFVLCRRVLEWEVALARIPSWRFRRDIRHSHWYLSPGRSLKALLKGRHNHRAFDGDISGEHNSDELPGVMEKSSPTRQLGSSLSTSYDDSIIVVAKNVGSSPAENPLTPQWPRRMIESSAGLNYEGSTRRRSATLPNLLAPNPDNVITRKQIKVATPPSPTAKRKGIRSLSKAQAVSVKWLFAFYTYAVVIFIILGPIRSYYGRHGLNGQEAAGWALGYLFGDSPGFRSTVMSMNLQQWVLLPQTNLLVANLNGRVEHVRWQYVGAANTRLLICLHCICTISLGIAVVFRLSDFVDVDTRRKVFHGMMVIILLPTIFVDPAFISLSLTLILAIALLLDLFRASQLPPISRPLTNFLAPYVDGRDHRGPVIVSHIFLLVGCSIPLWLSLASLERSGEWPWQGWEVPSRDLSMISGVVCVGMGDAAASLIGRRYGRRRWCWSGGKSLEGSTAFAIAVVVGLGLARFWLLYGGWAGDRGDSWPWFWCKAMVAASAASLTEAVLTGGNDNVIVPVILWLMVRGLDM